MVQKYLISPDLKKYIINNNQKKKKAMKKRKEKSNMNLDYVSCLCGMYFRQLHTG